MPAKVQYHPKKGKGRSKDADHDKKPGGSDHSGFKNPVRSPHHRAALLSSVLFPVSSAAQRNTITPLQKLITETRQPAQCGLPGFHKDKLKTWMTSSKALKPTTLTTDGG